MLRVLTSLEEMPIDGLETLSKMLEQEKSCAGKLLRTIFRFQMHLAVEVRSRKEGWSKQIADLPPWLPDDFAYQPNLLDKLKILKKIYQSMQDEINPALGQDDIDQLDILSRAISSKLPREVKSDKAPNQEEDKGMVTIINEKERIIAIIDEEDIEMGVEEEPTHLFRCIDKAFQNKQYNELLFFLLQLGELAQKIGPDKMEEYLQDSPFLGIFRDHPFPPEFLSVPQLVPGTSNKLGEEVTAAIIVGFNQVKQLYGITFAKESQLASEQKTSTAVSPSASSHAASCAGPETSLDKAVVEAEQNMDYFSEKELDDAELFFKNDLVPNTPNRRRLDKDIEELRAFAKATRSPQKADEALRFAEIMQAESDSYHKSKKTDKSIASLIKNTEEQAQQAKKILGSHQNSRGWSVVRKIVVTVGVISIFFKALYSKVTTGKWSVYQDITRSQGKLNQVVSSAKKIQADFEEKKKPAEESPILPWHLKP